MSAARVALIHASPLGVSLRVGDRELFLPFADFPQLATATIAQLARVEWPSPPHLYWPDLDVDIAVESIDHPERYPLVSVRP